MENNYKPIFQTSNPIEAEIIIQMLRENEINAVMMNKKDSSYPTLGIIEIYCPANQVITAIHLIQNQSEHEK